MENIRNKGRIWELDFFRGIALIFMIYFHVIFDMKEFFNYPVSYASGVNYYIGKASAILFMLVSGISCSLSRNNIKRGLKVLGIALVITAVTHLYNPGYGIKFGILHFFGISMLLYSLFQRINRYVLIVLGTAVIVLGNYVPRISVSYNYLFPLGIISSSFISSDYYPLIPWFGVFLYGIVLGKILYFRKQSQFNFNLGDNIISRVGQKTLLVYVVHQPITVLMLTLVNYLASG